MMNPDEFNEFGVTLKLPIQVQTILSEKYLYKKLQLGFSRAIALCSLSTLSIQTVGTISALDASGSFGLAGIQWVKHLGSDVNITINTAKGLKEHVENALDENECKIPGVSVLQEDVHIVMHSGKYMFIYLEVYGSAVKYFDAAFRSVNHNGLVCVTCTDTSIFQNKTPKTAYRLYGSTLLHTEYHKELATRVIVANMARAAARWNKGFKIELCTFQEHGITVVCRVLRGSINSDKTVIHLQSLAHCQLCQAREFIIESRYAVSRTSQPSVCECTDTSEETMAPVMMLGPLWREGIFNKAYLCNILYQAQRFELSEKYLKIFSLMIQESVCCSSKEMESELLEEINDIFSKMIDNSICKGLPAGNELEPVEKKLKLTETCNGSGQIKSTYNSADKTRPYVVDLPYSMHQVESNNSTMPAFYFDIRHHGIKGGNPPKLLSVIAELRNQGLQASRSHFDSCLVRTSANLDTFNAVLKRIWENTAKLT